MDQSSSIAASNGSTLAGLLALFNGGTASAGTGGDLFSALLTGTESTSSVTNDPGPQATTAAAATASTYPCANVDATSTNTLKALSDLAHTMRKIMSILRRDSQANSNYASHQEAKTPPAVANTDATSTTTTEADTLTSDDADTIAVGITEDTEIAQEATATDVTEIALSEPQTIEDVLAELVLLIQYIQQRLQELQAAQAEAVTDVASENSVPETPLLDALETLFGTHDDGMTTEDALTDDSLAPCGVLEALFSKTDKAAEKLLEALVDRAAKIATGETGAETDSSDELTDLVDLGTEIRETLASLHRIKGSTELTTTEESTDGAATTAANADAANTATSATSVATASDTAALNAVVVASSVTQKFSAAPAASNAKAAEIIAPRVARSETQNRAATTATTASATSTVSNATPSASSTPPISASASANADTDFGEFLSSGETYIRGANDNLRGFSGSEGVGATGSYSFSSTLSALRAANGGTTGLPSAVEQVVLHMNRCVKNGDTRISLQLQPGDLGKITVKLDVSSDGSVQGTVLADNPKTLEMLQKDSRSLERALQDAGLRAEPGSLEFSLSGQNDRNTEQSDKSSGANGTVSAMDSEDDAAIETAAVGETYYIRPSGVNIRV